MGKSMRSLDRIIEKVAEQAVEEAVDRKLEEVAAADNVEDTPSFLTPPSKSPIIDDLLQSIPSGEGYYLKLYREVSPGQFEFKLRIDDYAQWTDLESEITDIVRFHTKKDPAKWGSGRYRLLAYKNGARGIYSKPIILNIDGGESELSSSSPPAPPSSTTPDVKQQLSEMAELLKSVKVLIGEPQNQAEISRMMAESFKAGLAAVPSPANQDKIKDIMAVLSILKESGAIGQTQKDPTSAVKDAIVLLKEMGVIGQPKQESNSLRETIVLLKEFGLIGQPKVEPPKEDPYAMVERVLNLINLVKSAGGEVAGEKPSLGVELVRILGPRVPDMVSRITSTVDKVADVQRLKIERSLGRPTVSAPTTSAPLPTGPPSAPPAAEPETPPASSAPSAPSSATQQLHPVIAEIHNAIESRDSSYYPKLKQLIDIYIGPHMVPALVSGQINIAVFLSTLADQLGHPYFNEPQTHEYFKEFIEAQKGEKAAPSAAQTGPVIGRCNHCGAEYEYLDGLVPGEPEVCGENGCSGIIELMSSPFNKGVETGG